MKQIAIISGKGGTGKTTLSSSLALLLENHILADCDADAPNIYLLFGPKIKDKFDFFGGKKAIIDYKKCTNCGKCAKTCRFDAIEYKNNHYVINQYKCEGCGACTIICPVNAITLEKSKAGEFFNSETESIPLVHGRLYPGEDASGGLVSEIRNLAIKEAEKQDKKLILIDGAPGIGCPAISSVTGTNYVIIVTEPTVSGIHDLKRAIKMVQHFKIPFSIVINKYDINEGKTKEIEEFCAKEGFSILGKIPFDEEVEKATRNQKPVIVYKNSKAANSIKEIFKKLKEMLKEV